MFDRGKRRLLSAGASGAYGSTGRHIAAWLAIFGLYIQLFAAVLCTSPLTSGAALGNSAPICHSPATSHESSPAPDRARHDCPFCAAHCHAAMLAAPSLGVVQNFVSVSRKATLALYGALAPTRFSVGAPPRGPPA